MKSDESGLATLLMVMTLLTLALILVMRPYQRLRQHVLDFYPRLRRAQAFWQAEGVLACLRAEMHRTHGIMTETSPCRVNGMTIKLSGQRLRTVQVQHRLLTLERLFRLPLPTTTGVIKTSSRLILTRPARFMPDPGELFGEHSWQCTVLRYSEHFQAPDVTTYHPAQLGRKPYLDFPDPAGEYCRSGYRTLASDAAHTQHDFVHDKTLSPFRDLFNAPLANWREIAAKIHHQPISSLPDWLPHCARQIRHQIQSGQRIVWIDGGCFLSDEDVLMLNQTIQMQFSADGIILVIRDGAFAVRSQQLFRGAIIQFTTLAHRKMQFTGWEQSPLYQTLKPVVEKYDIPLNQLNYFQSGGFFPLGGLFLDVPGRYAVVDGELETQYQRDLILAALNLIRPVHWLPGSWYEK